MSTLYEARVLQVVDERTVDLEVQVVHPNAMVVPESVGFALQLLLGAMVEESPLAKTVDFSSLSELDWIRRCARGFVADVQIITLGNEPPADALDNSEHKYCKDPRHWLKCILRITGTHAAWISHLRPGKTWGGVAIDSASDYADCAVFEPENPSTQRASGNGEAVERDDAENTQGDGSAPEDDSLAFLRPFVLTGSVVTQGPALPSGDPRQYLRDHGLWEDLHAKRTHEHFFRVCKEGNLEAVMAYVALGQRLDIHEDISEETPLIRATEGNHVALIEFWVRSGAEIESRDASGDTALMTAIHWKKFEAAQKLLELGADANAPNRARWTPLTCAINSGQSGLVDLLLRNGGNPNALSVQRDSALHVSIREGAVGALGRLLESGGNPNIVDGKGDVLLRHAIAKPEILQLLLAKGADPHQENRWGWSPCDIAAYYGEDTVEVFRKAGIAPTHPTRLKLFAAARANDIAALELLPTGKWSVNERDVAGRTPLMVAAAHGNREIAEWLVDHGADPCAVDSGNQNALVLAIDPEIALWLLSAGAPVNVLDSQGRARCPRLELAIGNNQHELIVALLNAGAACSDLSPCHSSVVWGELGEELVQTLRLLAEAGADLEMRDETGKTLLVGFAERNFTDGIRLLVQAKVNLESEDDQQATALHKLCGAPKCHAQSAANARLLLDAGADVTHLDWQRKSPWEAAESVQNRPCMNLLREHFERSLTDAKKGAGLGAEDKPTSQVFQALVTGWNKESFNYETFLHWVRKGDQEVVLGLLEAGFDPNPRFSPSELPLLIAARRGDWAMADLLLRHNAQPNLAISYGITALHCAVENQKYGIVQRLLTAGADPNLVDDWGATGLTIAASRGDRVLMAALVDAGALIDPLPAGASPLLSAVRSGQFEAAEWLLNRGANINLREYGRKNALLVAIEKCFPGLASALVQAGIEVNLQTSDDQRVTPLILAARRGNVELIEALLSAGASRSPVDACGKQARDHAELRGVEHLLGGPSWPSDTRENLEQDRSLSPFLRAIYDGNWSTFADLLPSADPNEHNYRGDTALIIATRLGHSAMVKALIAAGADVGAKNCQGDLAYTYVLLNTEDELKSTIEQAGQTLTLEMLNQRANLGLRELEQTQALEQGDLGKVLQLIDQGVLDVHALGANSAPLEIALRNKDLALVKLLRRKGSDPSLKVLAGLSVVAWAESHCPALAPLLKD